MLPCPSYYKQCCDEYWGTRVSFSSGFLGVYEQQWDCWVIMQFYFQFFKESPHCSPYWLYQLPLVISLALTLLPRETLPQFPGNPRLRNLLSRPRLQEAHLSVGSATLLCALNIDYTLAPLLPCHGASVFRPCHVTSFLRQTLFFFFSGNLFIQQIFMDRFVL